MVLGSRVLRLDVMRKVARFQSIGHSGWSTVVTKEAFVVVLMAFLDVSIYYVTGCKAGWRCPVAVMAF